MADINAKLTNLLDREEIKAIPHRFARGLDRCDRDIIESCFHEDGSDDHGFFKGSATEFCDWVMDELKKYLASQHIISTQNIELSGLSAVCESYFLAFHLVATPDGNKEAIAAGRYVDEMEKRDDVWKISHRTCIFDWNRITDESPLPAPDPDTRYTGKKYLEDDSYQIFSKLLK
jgi:hypothetical protein